ncbi:hypothetical protein [Amycolatopsis sp. RTGN1]|uniref:hypothetical protein n=1 Tax=Amycolatopsis ponsaeliensis TaxID=2992142 RepID=UPI00254F449F|nr:hypothetical protein [Amycolatopsis sp. RTGN1]
MTGRVVVVGLIGPVCVLATIGALILPWDILAGWLLLGAGAGLLVAFGAPRLPRGRLSASGPDLLAGAATATGFLLVCLVVAGLRNTVGGGLTAAVLILLVVAGLVASHRRRATPPVTAGRHAAPVPRSVTPLPVADMATEDLCVAWRRSYFLLHLATDEQARRLVVQRRQDFLDEIERRDRLGFVRWLDSGAKPGSDPAPYLTRGG